MDTRTPRHSFGLLVFRRTDGTASIEGGSLGGIEVLIAHPGGPLWARKDDGAWSVPKGLPEADESPLDTARREFAEEIGHAAPQGDVIELGDVRQKSGKVVTAFIRRRDPSLTPELLDEHCKHSGLANFRRPRSYVFVHEIPRSPVGKLLRRCLVAGEYEPEKLPTNA